MTKNSDLCRPFFTALLDYHFKCNYCRTVRRQGASSGYTNLVSHLRDRHGDVYAEDYASTQAGNLRAFGFASAKVANIYAWMSWVVAQNLPLCEVENEETKRLSRLTAISTKTLKKYMSSVTRAVEAKINAKLTGNVGLTFDGWQCYSEHYIGLFAFVCDEGVLKQPLLALAPLEEGDQSAKSHCSFIKNILGIYDQTKESVRGWSVTIAVPTRLRPRLWASL